MTLQQANELRLGQVEIRRLVEARMNEIVDYLAGVPGLTPQQFRNSLIVQTNLVVSQFGDVAASLAAEWYDDIRVSEGVVGSFRATPQASPYGADAVDGMVRRAVGPMFDEVQDLAAVMRTVSQNAGKYVLGASRETVRRNSFIDPRGTGFQRVARPGACDFCIMLVGRGAVYKRETAFFASHGDCNCAAVPSWDPDAPEVDVELYEASRRTTDMSDAERSRHNSAIRDYMEHNRDDIDEYRKSLAASESKFPTVEDAMRAVNPRYGESPEWKSNCFSCVTAFEERMRGIDSVAIPSTSGIRVADWEKWFELPGGVDAAMSHVSSRTGLASEVDSWGPGSRGFFVFQWNRANGGGGHVVSVINDGGLMRVIDPQSGVEYDKAQFGRMIPKKMWAMRSDNLVIRESAQVNRG